MPSSLILARTCLTSSLRPFWFTWASRSVMALPPGLLRLVIACARWRGLRLVCRRVLTNLIPIPVSRPATGSSMDSPVYRIASSPLLSRSTPRERTVRLRMQLALGEAREAERQQQVALLARDVIGHQFADADHLVAVIGVGDEVGVLAESVEHGEAVGGEAPDAARRLLLVFRH